MNKEIKEKIKAYYISNDIDKILDYITNLQEENENLTHIVANKIIEDYDIDTPLKNQLNEERIKYINLSFVCNDYKTKIDKAIEYFKYQLEQLDFYEDTKARILCAMAIVLLTGDDKE